MTHAIGYVVIDARRLVGVAEVEIRIHQVARAAADIEFARAGFHRHIHGLRALPIHGTRQVLQIAVKTAIPSKRAPMPEKNHQHQHKRQRAKRRPQGRASPRAAIGVLPPPRGVPHLPQAHKHQDQWPVGAQNRPWIERRPPVRIQKHGANRDQHDRHHQRGSPRRSAICHHTPLLLLLRARRKKSSATDHKSAKRAYCRNARLATRW